MNEDLIMLGGSAVVIVIMVAAAVLLGFRHNARMDAADLARRLSEAEPGARLEASVIADDGAAAIGRLADGRLLVAKAMGDRVSLRFYPASAVRLSFTEGKLTAEFADLGFPPLHMALNEAPPWLVQLAGKLSVKTPIDPPFHIPDIIMYAVPGFVILILIEMAVVKFTKRGEYNARDSAASLLMGFGNRVAGILFGGIAVWAYFWVSAIPAVRSRLDLAGDGGVLLR